jgi:hypothetical protein
MWEYVADILALRCPRIAMMVWICAPPLGELGADGVPEAVCGYGGAPAGVDEPGLAAGDLEGLVEQVVLA